jgi:hypothetical protein
MPGVEDFEADGILRLQFALRSGALSRTLKRFEACVLRHVRHLLFDVCLDPRNQQDAGRQILRRSVERREQSAKEEAARFHGQIYYAFFPASLEASRATYRRPQNG